MGETTLIRNAVVYTPASVIDEGAVAFEDGIITAVGHLRDVERVIPSRRAEVIDAAGDIVCPGFIDRHLHGGGGADTMDADVDALRAMSLTHARFGVTAFCPTTMAAPDVEIEKTLAAVARAMSAGVPGATILGAHVEGPCISAEVRGAHREDYVRAAPPTVDRLSRFVAAASGHVRVWTVAPELPGATDFIRAAVERRVSVSVGHTRATYTEVMDAIDAGAASATHLFNAMTGLNTREPGAAMAVLHSRGRVMAEVIADGVHVHPAALHVALAAMGVDHVLLITDAMRPVGFPSMSSFELPGLRVFVRDGRVVTEEGTLCGSLLTMNQAVRNVVELVGRPLAEAIKLATINPARALGIADRKGSIEVGKDADLVIADARLNVKRTIVSGRTVYAQGS